MPAGRSNLECALGAFLSLYVCKIDRGAVTLADFWLRSRKDLRTLEMIGELDQRLCGNNLDLRASPGRFGAACAWANQPLAASVGADRGRQHAGHRSDRAVEPKLAQDGEAVQCIVRNCADCRHEAECNRQVIMAAFFGQI